jgi:hypothetical protein
MDRFGNGNPLEQFLPTPTEQETTDFEWPKKRLDKTNKSRQVGNIECNQARFPELCGLYQEM